MCNGRSAQQESGAALSKSSTYVSRCALIRTDGQLIHIQLRQKQHELEGQFTRFILHKGTLK